MDYEKGYVVKVRKNVRLLRPYTYFLKGRYITPKLPYKD